MGLHFGTPVNGYRTKPCAPSPAVISTHTGTKPFGRSFRAKYLALADNPLRVRASRASRATSYTTRSVFSCSGRDPKLPCILASHGRRSSESRPGVPPFASSSPGKTGKNRSSSDRVPLKPTKEEKKLILMEVHVCVCECLGTWFLVLIWGICVLADPAAAALPPLLSAMTSTSDSPGWAYFLQTSGCFFSTTMHLARAQHACGVEHTECCRLSLPTSCLPATRCPTEHHGTPLKHDSPADANFFSRSCG